MTAATTSTTAAPGPKSTNIVWHSAGAVTREERASLRGHAGLTLFLTGLSASGKSTIAAALELRLLRLGLAAYRLDGDNIRFGLNRDLGFSDNDRTENIRRIGEVARLFADAANVAITSFISPFRADRDAVRVLHVEAGIPFLEVFVDVPVEVAETRDPKGLYKKARAGEIKDFTGINSPYEAPEKPEIHLRTDQLSVDEAVQKIIEALVERELLPPRALTDDAEKKRKV